VPADVVVRTKLAVAVPADDDRAPGDLDDEVAAWLRKLVADADRDPRSAKKSADVYASGTSVEACSTGSRVAA
jgi:hypothetical protein